MSYARVAEVAVERIDQKIRSRRYKDDPVAWAEEYLGLQLWSKQKEILYSIRDNRATAVAAGHGVGKSFVAGVAACWWMDVHPPEKVALVSTAPTVAQTDVLWNNIKMFYSIAERRYEQGLVDHKLPGYVTGDNKLKIDGRKVGEGRKPANQAAKDQLQGTHATYLLAIGDEAVGLSGDILDALGNMATGPLNRQLLIANPTDPTSAMAKIWQKELSQWKRMHIGVFDSPAVTGEPGFDMSQASALSGMDYIEQMREQWGEDHPFYISRVLGQWAFDAGNAVFTEEEIATAIDCQVLPDAERTIHLGADIAFSLEGDFSSVYKAEWGEVWKTDPETGERTERTGKIGVRIRLVDKWKGAPLVGDQDDNPATDTRIIGHAHGVGAGIVKLDAAGLGAGVLHSIAARPVNFDLYKVLGSTPAKESRAYTNIRAETLFNLKLLARQGLLDLDGADEEMLDQLRGIVYEYDSTNRIKIESKADMKKRGKKSPDFADAVWYAFYDPTEDEDAPKSGDVITFEPDEIAFDLWSDARGLPV